MDLKCQEDEILALESIYDLSDFEEVKIHSFKAGILRIHVPLPCDFSVIKKNDDGEIEEKVTIENLPPIALHFQLPDKYPSEEPPLFLLSCPWLNRSKLSCLCKELDRIWEVYQSEILFSWVEHLRTDVFSILGISQFLDMTDLCHLTRKTYLETFDKLFVENRSCNSSPSDCVSSYNDNYLQVFVNNSLHLSSSCGTEAFDQRTFTDLSDGVLLLSALEDYDQKKKEVIFLNHMHDCKICLESKLGNQCTVFKDCNHLYCKACLKEYYKVLIADGDVQSLRCPNEKCSSLASPGQVKELVSPECFLRYERLLLDKTLDTMQDVIYCPRAHCQYPVITDAKSNLASCSACMFVFCTYCKRTYHGIEPCRISSAESQKLKDLYLNGSNEEQFQLEKKYGKGNIQKLIENALSEDWVKENSKSCPCCHCPIEKIDGCNKIHCHRCNAYFCWICNKSLGKLQPYLHFNDQNSQCFNKLFQGVDLDVAEDQLGIYL